MRLQRREPNTCPGGEGGGGLVYQGLEGFEEVSSRWRKRKGILGRRNGMNQLWRQEHMWVLGAVVVLLKRERVYQVGWLVNMLEMGPFQFH